MKKYFTIALLAVIGASSVQAFRLSEISVDEIVTKASPTVRQYAKKVPSRYIKDATNLKNKLVDIAPKIAKAQMDRNPKTIATLRTQFNK